VQVKANKTSGQIAFFDNAGVLLLQETERAFHATTDLGKPTFSALQSWETEEGEAQYGLGQYQNGFVNYKHAPIQLVQVCVLV
jgi:alpha-D-xyloside xylohydrolase